MLDDLIDRMKGKYRHILVGREGDRENFQSDYPGMEFVSGGEHSQFNDIHTSIRYAFQSVDTERLVFVTSDTPTLTLQTVEEAFRRLRSHDVVYAPSQDGASLIGLTRSSVFHANSPAVEHHTSIAGQSRDGDSAAMQYFKSFHAGHPGAYHLPTIPDIDSLADLISHYSLLESRHSPKTAHALNRFATDESFLFHLCCKVAEDSSPLDKRIVDGNDIIDDSGPKIGAVIVKDGKLVSTGHRFELGLGRHAEDCAIDKAGSPLAGGTLYSTFEPCTYRNSTFDLSCCADLIHKSGIREIVYGTPDPQLPHSTETALLPKGILVRQSDRLAAMSAYLTSVYMAKMRQTMAGVSL